MIFRKNSFADNNWLDQRRICVNNLRIMDYHYEIMRRFYILLEMLDETERLVASYEYDPYGRMVIESGSCAHAIR